jgi:hypothetical protein
VTTDHSAPSKNSEEPLLSPNVIDSKSLIQSRSCQGDIVQIVFEAVVLGEVQPQQPQRPYHGGKATMSRIFETPEG